ncbi:TetR/AcrR family transcriptional regulator [Nocardia sp. JMUB6875]
MGASGGVNEALRESLIQATIELVSTEGLHALTARRVSRMCGVSTMAVYTNFGGMAELIRAAGSAGFAQLAARMQECGISDDPIADLLLLGMVFRDEAQRRPELFQLMFGTGSPRTDPPLRRGNVLTGTSDFDHYRESFDHVVDAARRAVEAGLVKPTSPRNAAAQLWTGLYGYVQLENSGHLGEDGLSEVLVPAIVNLLVGMGSDRDAVGVSVVRALTQFVALSGGFGVAQGG